LTEKTRGDGIPEEAVADSLGDRLADLLDHLADMVEDDQVTTKNVPRMLRVMADSTRDPNAKTADPVFARTTTGVPRTRRRTAVRPNASRALAQ
jgi:hypothetical protein